eukprot:3981197-Heterocapsa_arctica.AAC.1
MELLSVIIVRVWKLKMTGRVDLVGPLASQGEGFLLLWRWGEIQIVLRPIVEITRFSRARPLVDAHDQMSVEDVRGAIEQSKREECDCQVEHIDDGSGESGELT